MSNSRTLNFVGSDLGIDVILMLTFTPPNIGKLYTDEFPLCWSIYHIPLIFVPFFLTRLCRNYKIGEERTRRCYCDLHSQHRIPLSTGIFHIALCMSN